MSTGESGDLRISFCEFSEFSARDAHDLLKLRFDIFVMEQRSIYPEIDGRDPAALHCVALAEAEIVGALRILGRDGRGPLSIGRVAVRQDYRSAGLGRRMMKEALAYLAAHAPGRDVVLGAQTQLTGWYESLGFAPASDEYDDGGIAHIEMKLSLPARMGD